MSADTEQQPFWKTRELCELTGEQWESLCDRCAKCCLIKLDFEDTGELCYTHLVCRYFDEQLCQCSCYADRTRKVPTCVQLTPHNLAAVHYMPATCAYRLLSEGKNLPWWHHLVSGSPEAVHEAGVSIRGKVLCEDLVVPDDWEDHIVDWVE